MRKPIEIAHIYMSDNYINMDISLQDARLEETQRNLRGWRWNGCVLWEKCKKTIHFFLEKWGGWYLHMFLQKSQNFHFRLRKMSLTFSTPLKAVVT